MEHDKRLKIARILHSRIVTREAVQLGKRVDYFRGSKLVEQLLNPSRKSNLGVECKSKEDALRIGAELLTGNLIHKSEVFDKKKKILQPVSSTNFTEDGFYTWIYEGSKFWRNFLLSMLILSIVGICLFPVWPQSAKVSIWYVSVTILIVLIGFILVRITIFLVLWGFGFDVWILPNFFDEDLSVADSFKPLVSAEFGKDLKDTWLFRLSLIGLTIGCGYWVFTQPNDFDEFLEMQKQFVNDLYTGNLLSDTADDGKSPMVVPDLSELEEAYEQDYYDEETSNGDLKENPVQELDDQEDDQS